MITPYKDGTIDFDAIPEIVEWYIRCGCTGIFAVCQSSEMFYLSLDERVALAKAVVTAAAGRVSVVVSGHCADSIKAQAEEISKISAVGADAFVLVSNRLDLNNDGDDVWIANAEKLLGMIPPHIKLGIYECPKPYKRLLTERILQWCRKTGRFAFIKDTCCDPDMLAERLALLNGSGIKLFNANAQTLLHSLQHGAAGYSGIMANFHPELYHWLFSHFETEAEKAELLSDILSMAAFTEGPAYPCTAKYHMNLLGIQMDTYSRSCDQNNLTAYQKLVTRQMFALANNLRKCCS